MAWELPTVLVLFMKGGELSSPSSELSFPSERIVLHLNLASLCSCYKCGIEFAEHCYVYYVVNRDSKPLSSGKLRH